VPTSSAAYRGFVQRVIDNAHIAGKDVLRVGSEDLDQTLRLIAKAYNAASYVGVDVESGPTARKPGPVEDLLGHFAPESFDLLICSEVLQHVEDWRRTISLFKRIIRPRGWILITTRSPANPRPGRPQPPLDPRPVEHGPACTISGNTKIFKEHELAHALLDGLNGLEIGAAAHNPFGLRARNVALPEGHEIYAEYQRREMGVEPAPVDIWSSADRIPVPDASQDFIVSSHVIEHLPNLIAAFAEWNRIVRDGGYVFMIVPLKGALPADDPRELTPFAHFVEDCYVRRTLETHSIEGVPGGRGGHYHTFTPESLLQVVEWMRVNRFCEWELVAREDVDRKVGNGFVLAFRVRHTELRADLTRPNWRFEVSDMEAIFSDFEILTLEADASGSGVFLFARKPVAFQERDLEECALFSVTANRRIAGRPASPFDREAGDDKLAQDLYDERYYETYHSASGVPYRREEPWLSLFAGFAERIVQDIQPRMVLDVGCAKGFLVEALRDRGVDAFGLDISEYAISQCREDITPYCWVASAIDPFPRRYDLIVCIEVLEHLPKARAPLAVANLCEHADDILFSSTPDDFVEPTHLNVQPVDYWAGLFAKHGFYRDVDFDVSFVAEHAVRFRRVTGPVFPVVRAYERKLWAELRESHSLRQFNRELGSQKHRLERELTDVAQDRQRLETELTATAQERERLKMEILERDGKVERAQLTIEEKDSQIEYLTAELKEIQSSLGWTLLSGYCRIRNRWLPLGSRRRAFYDVVTKGVKAWLS